MRAGGRDSVPGSAAETGAAACPPLARRRRQEATAAFAGRRGDHAPARSSTNASTDRYLARHGRIDLAAPARAPPPAPDRIGLTRVNARSSPLLSDGLSNAEIARIPLHQRET